MSEDELRTEFVYTLLATGFYSRQDCEISLQGNRFVDNAIEHRYRLFKAGYDLANAKKSEVRDER